MKRTDDNELNCVLRALADTTRRKIVDELVERDRQSLFEICTRLIDIHKIALTRQAISRHLGTLESAGIVKIEWQGNTKLHSLHTAPIRRLIENDGWIGKFEET